MAIVSNKVSDLSGKAGTDAQFAKVVVRKHPNIDAPKVLDILVDETVSFQDIKNLVVLEIQTPGGKTREVCMTLETFNTLGENMDGVLKNARGTRGREPGTKVTKR